MNTFAAVWRVSLQRPLIETKVSLAREYVRRLLGVARHSGLGTRAGGHGASQSQTPTHRRTGRTQFGHSMPIDVLLRPVHP